MMSVSGAEPDIHLFNELQSILSTNKHIWRQIESDVSIKFLCERKAMDALHMFIHNYTPSSNHIALCVMHVLDG